MSLASLKIAIAEKLEKEQLNEAYDLSRSVGLYDLSEDIADLIYCPDDEYQEFRKSIIDGLRK